MKFYEFEIGNFANKLVREIFKLKPGEQFVITTDTTKVDSRVADATAAAAFSVGAKPVIISIAYPLGWGRNSDPRLPIDVLAGALKGADAWVEYNVLHGSTPYHIAMEENKKLRYLCLGGTDADILVRTIGRVDLPATKELMETTAEMIRNSKHIRFTNPAGTDVEMNMPKTKNGQHDQNYPVAKHLGYADTPGIHMMIGQLAWAPKIETVNGKIIFDGSLNYGANQGGIIQEPIHLTVEAGKIVKIEGGREAKNFEAWLKCFDHPQMFGLAHTAIGVNSGAKISTQNIESERFWGSTEWGIGAIYKDVIGPDGVEGPAHVDGVSLDTSVWLDGKLILEDNKFLISKLAELAKKLGK